MTGESQVLALVSVVCLVATLLAATLSDVVSHRIPNVLLLPALLVAAALGITATGGYGLLMCLAGLCVGLTMLMPLYALGAMGAGDVKLLGVAGAFLGPAGALFAGLATFIAGAVFGGLWIGLRALKSGKDKNTQTSPRGMPAGGPATWFMRLAVEAGLIFRTPKTAGTVAEREAARKNSTFAYAPAIAAGSLFVIWQHGWSIPIGAS